MASSSSPQRNETGLTTGNSIRYFFHKKSVVLQFPEIINYARRSCREARNHRWVLLDDNYINEKTFEKLSEQVCTTKELISEFVSCRRKSPKSRNIEL